MKKRKLSLLKKIGISIVILIVAITSVLYGLVFHEINALFSIRKIKNTPGAYTMTYRGDYYFDEFLKSGGASSEEDVQQFLIKHLARGALSSQTEELVIPESACTSFNASTPDGQRLFARNFDAEYAPILLVHTDPYKGYRSVSTVNLGYLSFSLENLPSNPAEKFMMLAAPYAPIDGMNEKGVSIAVNILETGRSAADQQTAKPDLTTTTALRLVLDYAESTDHAIDLLRGYDLHDSINSSYHFQIADRTGKSAVIEYCDGQMQVIPSNEPSQVSTNFSLYAETYGLGFGQDRFEKATAKLEQTGGILTEAEAMTLLRDVRMKDFTCWSVVYNLSDLHANIVFRSQYQNETYGYRI